MSPVAAGGELQAQAEQFEVTSVPGGVSLTYVGASKSLEVPKTYWGEKVVEGVQKGDLALTFAPDHVFALPSAPRHEFAVLDEKNGRAVAIAARGNTTAVVWNSGEEAVCDHGPDDWRRFVCVEPVSDWPGGRTLAPGESYELEMAVQASLRK